MDVMFTFENIVNLCRSKFCQTKIQEIGIVAKFNF